MKRGFTLIELLVVIAIIGVLMGMLLPVMGKVRDHARQVNCASMMRQVGMAIGAYTVDASDHLPFVLSSLYATKDTTGTLDWNADPTDATAHPHELLPVLGAYLSDMPELVCPAAVLGYPLQNPKMTYRTAAANNVDGKVESVINDGAVNYYYSLKYLDGRRYEIKHVDVYSSPFRLVNGPGYYYLVRDLVDRADNGEFIQPHEGSVNQLYLDLHVSLYKEQDMIGSTYP